MTDVATGMVRPFDQKDRLDAAFEKLVVELRRRLRQGDCAKNGKLGQNRRACESATFISPSALQEIQLGSYFKCELRQAGSSLHCSRRADV